MKPPPVYILAGGRSSRFGSDKARATLDGTPLVVRLAERAAPIAESITVVADRPGKYDDLGLGTIGDDEPGLGPVGGLVTAMRHRPDADWLLLLTCDAIAFSPRWLDLLRPDETEARPAVAFRDRFWQPFPGLYAPTILPLVADRIARGRRSMQALLDEVGAAARPMPDDWPELAQVNTPEQLAAAQRRDR